MKSPVEELEVGGDRMSHLYNALTLHELNKKSVESLALLQCPVVKNIAEISDWELDEGNASFLVFASRGPKLAVEADDLSTEQILAGRIELLVLGVDKNDVCGAGLEKLESQVLLRVNLLFSKPR